MTGQKCANCHRGLTDAEAEDGKCCGCGNIVCEDCDIGFPMGSHELEDHLND